MYSKITFIQDSVLYLRSSKLRLFIVNSICYKFIKEKLYMTLLEIIKKQLTHTKM